MGYSKQSYAAMVESWDNWCSYADPNASTSKEEFEGMTQKERIEFMIRCFGAETVRYSWENLKDNSGWYYCVEQDGEAVEHSEQLDASVEVAAFGQDDEAALTAALLEAFPMACLEKVA